VKKKILQKAGLVEKDQAGERALDPIKCPRCETLNAKDSMYCRRCSMGLTVEAMKKAASMEEMVTEMYQIFQAEKNQEK
jgi:hypothetical protein